MDFTLIPFTPRTLAFASDRTEAVADSKLDAFLALRGVVPAHRYQNELVVKKNGLRLVAYIRYAEVPQGTLRAGEVSVSDLGAGEALSFFVSEDDYVRLADGDLKPAFDAYLSAHGLGWDLSKVIVLCERVAGGYSCLLPVRRK